MGERETKIDLAPFKALGKRVSGPSRELETFAAPKKVTSVSFTSDELTCNCPITNQPDFYDLEIYYHPAGLCLESKSLKLYLWSFRNEAMFAESLAAVIAEDIAAATGADYCRVTLKQHVRGGMSLQAVAEADRRT